MPQFTYKRKILANNITTGQVEEAHEVEIYLRSWKLVMFGKNVCQNRAAFVESVRWHFAAFEFKIFSPADRSV